MSEPQFIGFPNDAPVFRPTAMHPEKQRNNRWGFTDLMVDDVLFNKKNLKYDQREIQTVFVPRKLELYLDRKTLYIRQEDNFRIIQNICKLKSSD